MKLMIQALEQLQKKCSAKDEEALRAQAAAAAAATQAAAPRLPRTESCSDTNRGPSTNHLQRQRRHEHK